MRTTKELLILLRDYIIEEHPLFFTGMCGSSYNMKRDNIINLDERNHILEYLNQNKPNNTINGYWFPIGIKQPRINYLNEKIKTL